MSGAPDTNPLDDVRAARQLLQQCTDRLPPVMHVGGCVLNKLLGTNCYEPEAWYRVDESGITKVDD